MGIRSPQFNFQSYRPRNYKLQAILVFNGNFNGKWPDFEYHVGKSDLIDLVITLKTAEVRFIFNVTEL